MLKNLLARGDLSNPTYKGVAAPHTSFTELVRDTWVDRFLASDLGLNRFRQAFQIVLTIAVVLVAESLFVHFTHALRIETHGAGLPAGESAKAAAANQGFLVLALLFGAMIGMISSSAVNDRTARGQLITLLILPVAFVPALAFGIAIGGYRIPAMASLAVVLAAGTYLQRFGPRGSVVGMLLFLGDFMGFLLHGTITIGDMGWLTAEIGVGLVVAGAVRFIFFYPHQDKALARTQRSYAARARKVAALALKVFDDPAHSEHTIHRLNHQLLRLNEAALMIDAQLGDPDAVAAGSSGYLLHQRLFDIELALTNIARLAQAMTRLDLPADQRSEARLALLDAIQDDAQGAKAHAIKLISLLSGPRSVVVGEDRSIVGVPRRFADSVIALADDMTEWIALGTTDEGKGTFQPAVELSGGWLPGSSKVSAKASTERGTRWGEHIHLKPYTRTAIQIGIAVGAATVLGDLLSGAHFYWAVIAAFITFTGVSNSGEQIRKALYRVVGTVVGIGIGSLLADAVGHHTYWSIVVILISLFFGFYLTRISYAFMVIGTTVMIAQLYVQLGEFSNSLLLLRLGETALGAAIAVAVVILILPLRTRRVLRVALRDYVQALGQLVDHVSIPLLGKDAEAESALRADARGVDASYQALVATAQPLRRNLFGSLDKDTGQIMRLAFASRNYSRNLIADVEATGLLDAKIRPDINRASKTLHESLEVVSGAITGPRDVVYTRSSALFDRVDRYVEERPGVVDESRLVIRDLKLLDDAMAQMAETMGLGIQ